MSKTIWVSANNTGHGADPGYARFTLTATFLAKVKQLQALMEEHKLSEVRFLDGPDSWGPDSEDNFSEFSRLSLAECVVMLSGVYFNDTIKHEDGHIQTTVISINDLEEALLVDADHVFFADNSEDDLKDEIRDCGDVNLPEGL